MIIINTSFISKWLAIILVLNTFVLIIIDFTTTTYAYSIYKIDKKNSEKQTDIENDDFSFLITQIDEKIKDFQQLIKELKRREAVLKKLSRVQKYIHMDIASDLDKVEKIAKETPLDIETAAIVVSYAEKLDLKPSLILAVIKLESNFNKYEVGEDNDRGYMQIIPSTEKWLAKKYGYKLGLKYNPKRIFEPEYNIGLGAIYLSILKESYGENYNRILSEYNRGPYNLREYYNKHKTYVTSYSRGVLRREKAFLVFND